MSALELVIIFGPDIAGKIMYRAIRDAAQANRDKEENKREKANED